MKAVFLGKKLSDGKGIGSKGRLTLAQKDAIQSFYGKTIRDFKGDSEGMSKATHAIIKHYSNTPEKPGHEDYPQDRNPWCSYHRDIAARTNYHQPIKNPLPLAVVAEIQLFDRLGSKEFLVSCEKGSTQKKNEAYHQVVWKLAPKVQYNSPCEIKLAVEGATLLFNSGMQYTFKAIANVVGVTATQNMTMLWDDIDKKRTTEKL